MADPVSVKLATHAGPLTKSRFQAVMRLFRIILDVNSPSFGVEGRQWKTSVTDIFKHFFGALWMDDRVSVGIYAGQQATYPIIHL